MSFAVSGPVKVAVFDTGCNIAYKEGISLVDTTIKDDSGHGTMVAEIIKEMCPGAELYVIKVIGKDGFMVDEDSVLKGLEWAISRGVRVINMSLRLTDNEALHLRIREAYRRGIVIVAAAGNKQRGMTVLSAGDVRYDANDEIACPAKYKEVIAVGAHDSRGTIYADSMQGEEVDLVCRGYRGQMSGTSVASAYAAGLAARIISGFPDNDVEQIKKTMQEEVNKNRL